MRPRPVHANYVPGRGVDGPDVVAGPALFGVLHSRRWSLHLCQLPGVVEPALVAAFNAGFRVRTPTVATTPTASTCAARTGAASCVIYKDGTMTLGAWGTQGSMSNQVASVRQNLDLIVDHGKAVPGLRARTRQVGKTLGGSSTSGARAWVSPRTAPLSTSADRPCRSATSPNVLVLAGAVRECDSTSTRAGSSSPPSRVRSVPR